LLLRGVQPAWAVRRCRVPARAFDAATFTCDEQENLVKTLGIIFGVLAVGLPGPAYAQGWYIGLGLAPAWLDTEFKYPDASRLSPDVDTSLMVNGAVGYKWQGWRFEAEPYWTEADTSKARAKLDWQSKIEFRDLVAIMVDADVEAAGLTPRGDGKAILEKKIGNWNRWHNSVTRMVQAVSGQASQH
jgi:hypothetical protein